MSPLLRSVADSGEGESRMSCLTLQYCVELLVQQRSCILTRTTPLGKEKSKTAEVAVMNGMPKPILSFTNRNTPCLTCGGVRFLWIGGRDFLCVGCGSTYVTTKCLTLNLKVKGLATPPYTPTPVPVLPMWQN